MFSTNIDDQLFIEALRRHGYLKEPNRPKIKRYQLVVWYQKGSCEPIKTPFFEWSYLAFTGTYYDDDPEEGLHVLTARIPARNLEDAIELVKTFWPEAEKPVFIAELRRSA